MTKRYRINIEGEFKGSVLITKKDEIPRHYIGTIIYMNTSNNKDLVFPDGKTDLFKLPITDEAVIEALVIQIGYDYQNCDVTALQ